MPLQHHSQSNHYGKKQVPIIKTSKLIFSQHGWFVPPKWSLESHEKCKPSAKPPMARDGYSYTFFMRHISFLYFLGQFHGNKMEQTHFFTTPHPGPLLPAWNSPWPWRTLECQIGHVWQQEMPKTALKKLEDVWTKIFQSVKPDASRQQKPFNNP